MRARRWWRPALVSGLLAFGAPCAAVGDGEISPDRPDVTSGTTTVAPGVVQIETGVEFEKARVGGRASDRRLGLQAALRTGLTDRLEVMLEGEPLVRLRDEGADTGAGDLTLVSKYRFLDAEQGRPWPALGVESFLKIPSARAPIGSERLDLGVVALASFELPSGFGLDVNAGLAAVGQRDGHLLQALASASLSWELARGWVPFAEVFFASRAERDGRGVLGLTAGTLYRLTADIAVDAAARTSLAGAGPDYAVTGGVSVRFGR